MLELIVFPHFFQVKGLDEKQFISLKELMTFKLDEEQLEIRKREGMDRAEMLYKQGKIGHYKKENLITFYQKKYTGEWCKLEGNIESNIIPIGLKRRVSFWLYFIDKNFKITDHRVKPPELKNKFEFVGKLRDYQNEILFETLEEERGIYNIGAGGGKTVLAIALMSKRNVKTFIVVPTIELVDQWIKRLQQFLSPPHSIGFISRGKFIDGDVVVASQPSLHAALNSKATREKTIKQHEIISEVWRIAGFVIIDECHRAGADTYLAMMGRTDAYFVVGLTATVDKRHDQRDIEYYALIGETLKVKDNVDLTRDGYVTPIKCWFHKVPYRFYTKGWKYQQKENVNSIYWDYIVTHTARNKIFRDITIDRAFNKGLQTLVLFKRIFHGNVFLSMIQRELETNPYFKSYTYEENVHYAKIDGEIPQKKRRPIYDKFIRGEMKCLIAQMKLLGEGWDVPNIRVIVVIMGDKSEISKIQNMTRGNRLLDGKDYLELHDGADQSNRIVQDHAIKRAETYKRYGAELVNADETYIGHMV